MNTRFTRRAAASALALLISAGAVVVPALAQSRRTPPQAPQKKNPRPDETQTTDPQLKQQEPQEPVPPDALKEQEVVRVASNIVQVEAVVYNKKSGQIVMGLKKENFAIFEDGIQRDVTNFSTPDAPITVAVVMEYSKLGQDIGYMGSGGQEAGQLEVLRPMATFLSQFIKPPDDYVSVIAYDMRPTPLTDFTNDPGRINQVINLLLRNQPAFRETNLFDALKLTLAGGRADSVVLENSREALDGVRRDEGHSGAAQGRLPDFERPRHLQQDQLRRGAQDRAERGRAHLHRRHRQPLPEEVRRPCSAPRTASAARPRPAGCASFRRRTL